LLVGLLIILVLVLTLPFFVKVIERNLEPFLFVMGLAATIISGVLNTELIHEIITNHLMYMITAAVLIFGLLFARFQNNIHIWISKILEHIPLNLFIFLMVVLLGLCSSIITAIISALILSEIINALPLQRKEKINTTIIGCFSIGLGAALTPIGEPLSTIVVSKLNEEFFYLLKLLGVFIIPGVIAFGVLGSFAVKSRTKDDDTGETVDLEDETTKGVLLRAGKIFLFIMALELLGQGFKPVIDAYIIHLE